MIIHTDEKQPVGRGGRPGLGARPGLEQRGHVFGFAPPTTDLNERPDDGSYHVPKEPISRYFIREQTASITPC